MSLKEYDVEINGHITTLQLSDEDAKALGLAESHAKAAKAPANKAARPPANKARTAANKSGGDAG